MASSTLQELLRLQQKLGEELQLQLDEALHERDEARLQCAEALASRAVLSRELESALNELCATRAQLNRAPGTSGAPDSSPAIDAVVVDLDEATEPADDEPSAEEQTAHDVPQSEPPACEDTATASQASQTPVQLEGEGRPQPQEVLAIGVAPSPLLHFSARQKPDKYVLEMKKIISSTRTSGTKYPQILLHGAEFVFKLKDAEKGFLVEPLTYLGLDEHDSTVVKERTNLETKFMGHYHDIIGCYIANYYYLGTFECTEVVPMGHEAFKKLSNHARPGVIRRAQQLCKSARANANLSDKAMAQKYESGELKVAKLRFKRVTYDREIERGLLVAANTLR
ncbi:hypothetical protein HGRIS_009050 [Hohenbuehelia grisea]|uniref:Uncharacterized protein n=1 Tax=Hohenbuehelia grisea TaxID=104357 RepID=A0ABR3J0E4_9AGAR